jgi:hypothetical protein
VCAACSTLAACAGDASLLLARGLEDAFPDAKRAAAAGLAALAATLPPGGLEDCAERLVQVRAGGCGRLRWSPRGHVGGGCGCRRMLRLLAVAAS